MSRLQNRRHSIITALAILALTGVAAAQHTIDVRGLVVDEHARPVAGVTVATRWRFDSGIAEPGSFKMETSADGSFSGAMPWRGWSVSLMAMNADRTRGGFVILEPAHSYDDSFIIVLGPLVRVQGTITCEGLGHAPEPTGVQFSLLPGRVNIATCASEDARFSVDLPPGEYHLWAWGTEVQHYFRESLIVPADQPVVDLGVIDMEASIISQHWGKAPPKWNVTDARGAKVGVQPSDYKGKWLLLEFWGYW